MTFFQSLHPFHFIQGGGFGGGNPFGSGGGGGGMGGFGGEEMFERLFGEMFFGCV